MLKKKILLSVTIAAIFHFISPAAYAHIDILSHITRHGRDEIKNGPCGMTDSERGTNIYTYEPGETITIEVEEYISHPGYFRIAFDDNGDDDFLNPQSVDPVNCDCTDDPGDHCGESDFYNNDAVLMDNLEPHNPADYSAVVWTFEVELPDIECDNCTLQFIQVMTDSFHAPYDPSPTSGDIYYQCIDLVLKEETGGIADPSPEDTCPVKFMAKKNPDKKINVAAFRIFREKE